MHVHARDLADGTRLEAEIAIVGAGPAGIVTALELARSGRDVLLVESGGTSFDAGTQRLGDAARLDPHHVPLALATRRQVGGASTIWGGRCVPYDPVDFMPRAIAPGVRWPLGYDELTPYFGRACEWFACGRPVFDARDEPSLAARTLVPGLPDGEVRASSLERWSLPTNFGRRYGRELRRHPRVRLVTGLTCTEIVPAADGRGVDHLRLRSLAGPSASARARRYVIACGGLESTRLLLASRGAHPRGMGNESGHLGRWYMAHVESRIAQVTFTTRPDRTIYAHERDADGVYVRRRFSFAPEHLLEHDLPNAAIWLVNPRVADPSHGSGVLSFVYLALASPLGHRFTSEAIRRTHVPAAGAPPARAHVRNVLRDLGPAARFAGTFAWQRFVRPGRKVPGFFVPSAANRYPLLLHGEHLPQPDSRVALSGENDALGMPRLSVDLRFSAADVDGAVRVHEHLDAYLRRHGVGRVEMLSEDPHALVREQLHGGYHQTGTTRMSDRPEDGVLDADLAVHGRPDLHVLSTSAFPTSSQANSTFMLVVFALRLADRLRRQGR